MHLLVIPSWFPQYPGDPSGSFFETQARGLRELGLQVGVVYPDLRAVYQAGKYLRPITQWAQVGGVNVLRHTYINLTPRVEPLILPRWLGKGMRLFDQYCARFGRPDIVHAHCLLRAGALAARIRDQHGIPYVVTEHSSRWHRHEISGFEMGPARQAAAGASALISVSNALLAHLRQDLELPSAHVVPNAVDSLFFAREPRAHAAGEGIRFINVALLNPGKRHDLLIDAFLRAFGRDTRHRLDIVGDGPQRQALERQVAQCGLGSSVRLLGMQPREQVAELLAASDCFALTSDHETFGVVLLEAFATGLPAVSTACGGTDDIVLPENGMLAEAGNVEAVAHALETMCGRINAGFYDRKRIRAGCSERFSQQAVCSRLVNIYQEALK